MEVHLDKPYVEHSTYGDLGLLNYILDVHIDQCTGYGIFGTYRFVDSWITGCNIGSTLANISVEGGPLRILGNHLDGSPLHNIELRGNKRITIADGILEGSRREAIVYVMPPWLSEDSPQIQITGNAFSDGGKESEGVYSAIRFAGVATWGRRCTTYRWSGTCSPARTRARRGSTSSTPPTRTGSPRLETSGTPATAPPHRCRRRRRSI